jgi:hypothetical protein
LQGTSEQLRARRLLRTRYEVTQTAAQHLAQPPPAASAEENYGAVRGT